MTKLYKKSYRNGEKVFYLKTHYDNGCVSYHIIKDVIYYSHSKQFYFELKSGNCASKERLSSRTPKGLAFLKKICRRKLLKEVKLIEKHLKKLNELIGLCNDKTKS